MRENQVTNWWKSLSIGLFTVLCSICSFYAGTVAIAMGPILDYYHDAGVIDKRLADLEDRVDRNDARIEKRWTEAWEENLQEKRELYQPILKGVKE